MAQKPFKRPRIPPAIIQRAIWLYARFRLSLFDVEELLAERGLTSRTRPSVSGFWSPGGRSPVFFVAAIQNAFYVQSHLLSRSIFKTFRAETFAVWKRGCIAAW